MSEACSLIARLDEQIKNAEEFVLNLKQARSPSSDTPSNPAENTPQLPTLIKVKVSGAKGYGWVAKQINKQMAVFPDWQPMKAKTIRRRMGGQMLHSKTYTFKPEELSGSGFLDGGVKGKALKRAMQSGKAWRNGGREKYLAKVKAEKEAKAKAQAEAKLAEEARQKAAQEAKEAKEAELQRLHFDDPGFTEAPPEQLNPPRSIPRGAGEANLQTMEHLSHEFGYMNQEELDTLTPEQARFLGRNCYKKPELIEGKDGYAAMVVLPDDSREECSDVSPVMVHRGTDDIDDVATDLDPNGVGLSQYNQNAELIKETIDRTRARTGKDLVHTGHSLGGTQAQRAGSDHAQHTREIVTQNAPGLSKGEGDRFNYRYGPGGTEREIPTTHVITRGDPVSDVGEQHLDGKVLLCNVTNAGASDVEKPILAHRARCFNGGENNVVQELDSHHSEANKETEDIRQMGGAVVQSGLNRINPMRMTELPPDKAELSKQDSEGIQNIIENASRVEAREARAEQARADKQIKGARSAEDVNTGLDILHSRNNQGTVEIRHND